MTEQKQADRRIELEIFTPALQDATRKAQAEGHDVNAVIPAAANAYLNMIVALIGKENALDLLEKQVAFLKEEAEK